MENKKKKKIALIRGDSLNEWEGGLWNELQSDFDITGFCSKNNLYSISNLTYPVRKFASTSDNFLMRNVSKFKYGIFQNMKGLENELEHFDIAHTAEISYYFTNQAVRAKKINKNLKVVTTIWDNSFGRFEYNYWPKFSMPPKYWREKINQIIQENVKGVDLFLPVSEFSAQMLYDYGVPKEKVQILTPAVILKECDDIDIFTFMKKEHNTDLEKEEIYLSVSRLVKEKGIYDVLYAWKMYIKEKKNKKLIFVGNGSERENLIRLTKEFGLQESVLFIKNIPNELLRKLYLHVKCLVLASLPTYLWQEQFGYVLAEAIIQDCPVIAGQSGAIPEVVGDAGILIQPGNPLSIKKALEDFDNLEIYKKKKENCNIVKQKFLVEKFQKELSDVYIKLLEE